MQTLVVTIPLPPKVLHPNARPHWRARARATRAYRRDCGLATKDAMNRAGRAASYPWGGARVQARFYFARRPRGQAGRHDRNNLNPWLKAAFDALQDAGLITNDVDLTDEPPLIFYGHLPRVELYLTAADAAGGE